VTKRGTGWPKTEADLARPLVEQLRELGWTVYQEVEWYSNGPRADIVATQGRLVWVIECKKSLSIDVLGQAHGWRGKAHVVSVAVPASLRRRNDFTIEVAVAFGIGVLHVTDPAAMDGAALGDSDESEWTRDWIARRRQEGRGSTASLELVRPAFHRHIDSSLRKLLIPERENFAEAGNADGKRYTAFQATCDKVRARLRDNGPLTVKKLVAILGKDHHYASEASAIGSLRKWIEADKLEGVELVMMGKGQPNLVRLVGQALPVGCVLEVEAPDVEQTVIAGLRR
jgi:hypothetical protein